jgi:hypothetical protein
MKIHNTLAVSGIPAYIPTPIDQLQREEDARHKRRELIDRQQRIRERLEKQQKEATTITKDKKAWANGLYGVFCEI